MSRRWVSQRGVGMSEGGGYVQGLSQGDGYSPHGHET